jgi:DNA-binding winged helix-turn-helix (wHTH) protein
MEPGPGILSFDLFEMDLSSRELRRQGKSIPLQDKAFQLLALLLETPGKLVSREEIRQRLWNGDTHVEFDDNLNHAVRKLRQVLGDSPDKPRFVQTFSRRGYRFLAPVKTEPCPGDRKTLALPDAQGRLLWLCFLFSI